VTPDFELPAGFFNPAGDTVSFVNFNFTYDSRSFPSAPTNGVDSLNFVYGVAGTGTSAVNSPTNFSGTSGSVNLSGPSPTGDYNGNQVVDAADYSVWRDTLGKTVTKGAEADGNGDGTINDADFTFWKNHFGTVLPGAGGGGLAAAAPEPATLILLAAGVAALVGTGRLARRLLR